RRTSPPSTSAWRRDPAARNERRESMLEDWPFLFVQVVTLVMVVFVAVHAVGRKEQKARWILTLLFATGLGLSVEHAISTGEHPSYCYSPKFFSPWGVPLWVGVGWGMVIYASQWTAERLYVTLPFEGLVTGFLAVNVDLSLDPVATGCGF